MQKTLYILITIAILGTIAVYTVPKANNPTPQAAIALTTTTTITTTPTPTGQVTPTSITQPTPTVNTGLQDGTYTGNSSSNRFGTVQVAINVQNGQITNVDFLQMPDGDSRSADISDYAGTQLEQATISAQSANIDTISGATYTSDSYIDSLQSAIDQAKA